jgi:dethiobiotin synthetase
MTARTLFIAGAHTEIGKTHVAAGLLQAARARGLVTEALKPVVSGFDSADWGQSDPGRLLRASGAPLTWAGLNQISPWRFRAPLAPPSAHGWKAAPCRSPTSPNLSSAA